MYLFLRALLSVGCLIVVTKCQDYNEYCMTPNSEYGSCVLVRDCRPMMNFLQTLHRPVPQSVTKQLNRYVCRSGSPGAHVCCPNGPIVLPTGNSNNGQHHGSRYNCKTPNDADGSCIVVRRCKPMLEALQFVGRPVPQSVSQEVNRYVCGSDNGETKICCPDGTITLNGGGSDSGPPDVSRHRNLGLLPYDCGYLDDANDKIRNGQNAELNEFPWMALLGYRSSKGVQFQCGGTIINERYILTAAHCIKSSQNPYTVRVGEYNLATRNDCVTMINGKVKCTPGVQNVAVEQNIVHPDYNSYTISNDIALIRVHKININLENIRPVCLPLGDLRNSKPSYYIVTGWGVVDIESGRTSDILQKVSLKTIDLKTCSNIYKSQSRVKLTEKQICAGGKNNQDACPGDSGGPIHEATFFNEAARYIQQGVVSFGPRECGLEGYPGVYTNVAYYMDWILDNLKP
ncbi:unnamed protein product [Phyllotreta striolata]|uniref:CLIP domain-containing serine protease n=1 Tax=Phyllotreta striolata TaxID=444603 RepID=A0A9P0DNX1_PHYSR|nr:unnamed protein product [Phyllotreta striolata]